MSISAQHVPTQYIPMDRPKRKHSQEIPGGDGCGGWWHAFSEARFSGVNCQTTATIAASMSGGIPAAALRISQAIAITIKTTPAAVQTAT